MSRIALTYFQIPIWYNHGYLYRKALYALTYFQIPIWYNRLKANADM